jgi:hypothetical protein
VARFLTSATALPVCLRGQHCDVCSGESAVNPWNCKSLCHSFSVQRSLYWLIHYNKIGQLPRAKEEAVLQNVA